MTSKAGYEPIPDVEETDNGLSLDATRKKYPDLELDDKQVRISMRSRLSFAMFLITIPGEPSGIPRFMHRVIVCRD